MLNSNLIDLSTHHDPHLVATLFKQNLKGFIRFPSFLTDIEDDTMMAEKLRASPDIHFIQMVFTMHSPLTL
jgi:hypothetical protein